MSQTFQLRAVWDRPNEQFDEIAARLEKLMALFRQFGTNVWCRKSSNARQTEVSFGEGGWLLEVTNGASGMIGPVGKQLSLGTSVSAWAPQGSPFSDFELIAGAAEFDGLSPNELTIRLADDAQAGILRELMSAVASIMDPTFADVVIMEMIRSIRVAGDQVMVPTVGPLGYSKQRIRELEQAPLGNGWFYVVPEELLEQPYSSNAELRRLNAVLTRARETF